jgi:hypothetical protein
LFATINTLFALGFSTVITYPLVDVMVTGVENVTIFLRVVNAPVPKVVSILIVTVDRGKPRGVESTLALYILHVSGIVPPGNTVCHAKNSNPLTVIGCDAGYHCPNELPPDVLLIFNTCSVLFGGGTAALLNT